jgi:hypothetical protein
MNQKQLANVLIKVLGLSLCAQSGLHIVSGVFNLFAVLASRGGAGGLYLWLNPLSGVVLAIIGVLFIALSRDIADFLIKDE